MSTFHKLSHAIWHCQFHLAFYGFQNIDSVYWVGQEVRNCIQVFCGRLECEVVEPNQLLDRKTLIGIRSCFIGENFRWQNEF